MNHTTLNGVYLVIDVSMSRDTLLQKVAQALEGGVQILQIWNNWDDDAGTAEKEALINTICSMGQSHGVPVLINEAWVWLKKCPLDGVHFDAMPSDLDAIRAEVGRPFIAGITCGNDLETVRWAHENELDYISFCAMFPSASAGSCEIVSRETVRAARRLTDVPLFLSGGITPDTMQALGSLDYDGVAVISGILNADSPDTKTSDYKAALNQRASQRGAS